jgi:hypothetical protein
MRKELSDIEKITQELIEIHLILGGRREIPPLNIKNRPLYYGRNGNGDFGPVHGESMTSEEQESYGPLGGKRDC